MLLELSSQSQTSFWLVSKLSDDERYFRFDIFTGSEKYKTDRRIPLSYASRLMVIPISIVTPAMKAGFGWIDVIDLSGEVTDVSGLGLDTTVASPPWSQTLTHQSPCNNRRAEKLSPPSIPRRKSSAAPLSCHYGRLCRDRVVATSCFSADSPGFVDHDILNIGAEGY